MIQIMQLQRLTTGGYSLGATDPASVSRVWHVPNDSPVRNSFQAIGELVWFGEENARQKSKDS